MTTQFDRSSFLRVAGSASAAFVIAFHNTWSGIPAVLTLVGWCLLIKSLIRLCAPKLALKAMAR